MFPLEPELVGATLPGRLQISSHSDAKGKEMDEQLEQQPHNRIQLVIEHAAGVTEHTIAAFETDSGYLLQQVGLSVLSGSPDSITDTPLVEAIRLCKWAA